MGRACDSHLQTGDCVISALPFGTSHRRAARPKTDGFADGLARARARADAPANTHQRAPNSNPRFAIFTRTASTTISASLARARRLRSRRAKDNDLSHACAARSTLAARYDYDYCCAARWRTTRNSSPRPDAAALLPPDIAQYCNAPRPHSRRTRNVSAAATAERPRPRSCARRTGRPVSSRRSPPPI